MTYKPDTEKQGASVSVSDTSCPVEPIPELDCGEVRFSGNPQHVIVGEVRFKVPSCYPRTVLLGITKIDVNILRLKAEVRSVADDRAIVNMSTWSSKWTNTEHYGSACSWLSIPPNDIDIQSGRYHTKESRTSASQPQTKTSSRITFARPYAAPPKVAVWLNLVNSEAERNVRVTTWADNITSDGFTIHLDTWDDSKLWVAGATWLAHSAYRTDVRSGQFHTDDVRPGHAAYQVNRGRVSWGVPSMARPPRVFTALRFLDFQQGRNVRLTMETSEVTTTGMTWNLNSWSDTIFYQAGAVFVVFDDDQSVDSAD